MTAKELFIKSDDAKFAAKFLESLPFQHAAETAVLEYQDRICTMSNDVNAAAANHFRLEGARSLISILKTITKPTEVQKHEPIGQLKHV